ncbi:hypothetical protein tb265_27670 [Gemmatimonadetes bacterium T265]|nr:hypothetical protein tb265_27670 [Gemmatimonadetes bacterium T265]
MAVTEQDVRHVAALARLGLDDARVPALVAELNGILVHMDALRRVKTDGAPVAGVGAGGMPLRDDAGPPYPLAYPREDVGPAMRAGFYLVPRLATHTALKASEGDDADDANSANESSVDDAVAADVLAQDGEETAG